MTQLQKMYFIYLLKVKTSKKRNKKAQNHNKKSQKLRIKDSRKL